MEGVQGLLSAAAAEDAGSGAAAAGFRLGALATSTALWKAAANGHTSVAQQLLEAGAAANHRALQREGRTVLHAAVSDDSASSVEVLQLLLDAGVPVNAGARSMAGTALHHAAGSGSVPAVKVLIAAGADVNAVDSDRTTPLHKAAGSGRASVVAVLVMLEQR